MIWYILLFIIGNVAYWVTSYFFDYKTSIEQVSHGLSEGDLLRINRDKHGYFSPSRFWLFHLIYWAAATAGAIILWTWEKDRSDEKLILMFYIMLCYFPFAIVNFVTYLNNSKKLRVNREKQREVLRILSAQPAYDYDFVMRLFSGLFWKERSDSGRIRAMLFPWWYMDGGHDMDFQERFAQKLYERAKLPESEWFKDTRLTAL